MNITFLLSVFKFLAGFSYDKLKVTRICVDKFCFPRVIWSFWDNEKVPEDIQNMLDVTRNSLENFTHCFLTPKNLSSFLDVGNFPPSYFKLGRTIKSDFMRVSLLQKYGGVWLDSSIIINSGNEMENVIMEVVKYRAGFLGFKYGWRNFEIQMSFIAAPEKSSIMKAYLEEFERALRIGQKMYVKKICTDLREKGVLLGVTRCSPYFIVDLLFTKIRMDNPDLNDSILFLPENRGHMRLALECSYNIPCMAFRYLHHPAVKDYPFIKFPRIVRVAIHRQKVQDSTYLDREPFPVIGRRTKIVKKRKMIRKRKIRR